MDARILRRLPAAVAAGGLVFFDCVAAPASSDGPFATIPALPTACYAQGDQLLTKLETAKAAVARNKEQQEEINARIKAEYDKLDPMEMSQRMTQWMMDNPEDAAKFAQATQDAGDSLRTGVEALANEEMQFHNGYKELADRYTAAMQQARGPAEARFAALNKRLADAGCSFGSGECTQPDYALPELQAVLRMADAAYQAACPQWWGAQGEIPNYVKRHREWLVTKYLPAFGQIDALQAQQFAIMNTPAASYKSTLPHQKASSYIDDIWKIYWMRPGKPYCSSVGCEGFMPGMNTLDTGGRQ